MTYVRRLLTAGLLALAVSGGGASAALAAPVYPPGGGESITVDTTTAAVGGSVTVTAKTFLAGSDVDVDTATDASSGTTSSGSFGGGARGATGVVPLATSGTCETDQTCTVIASSAGVATATVRLTRVGATNITFSGTGVDGEPLEQTIAITVGADDAAATTPNTGTNGSDLASTGPRDLIQTVAVALLM